MRTKKKLRAANDGHQWDWELVEGEKKTIKVGRGMTANHRVVVGGNNTNSKRGRDRGREEVKNKKNNESAKKRKKERIQQALILNDLLLVLVTCIPYRVL